MIELLPMRTFILTVELGSLIAVSKVLHISSAAISKQLTKMESDLGVQLLLRSTRRVELTKIGIRYYEQCKHVLEEVDALTHLISAEKQLPSGSLKIISGRHFATSFIVPYLKEFLIKYPNIDIHLELAERMADLDNEDLDVQIGMSVSATGNVIQKKIATTRYCYCASPSYLKKHGIPFKPQDLAKHHYLTHSMRHPCNQLVFSNQDVITVNPYVHVNDAEMLVQLVKDGVGIAKLHEYVVHPSIQSGECVEILAPYSQEIIPLYVAFPQRRFVLPKIRAFVDFIVDKVNLSRRTFK